MKKIQWDDSLTVGIAAMDQQHKQWIECYNNVVTAIEEHHGALPVAETISFLVDFTNVHIAAEEDLMARVGYPGLDDHREEHNELRMEIENLVLEFEEEDEAAYSLEEAEDAVETFLGQWLVAHIRQTDRMFGTYVTENGIRLS